MVRPNSSKTCILRSVVLVLCITFFEGAVSSQPPPPGPPSPSLVSPPRAPPRPPSLIQCPDTCSDTLAPCRCFRDGWVSCQNVGIETLSFPLLFCVRRLVISGNAIDSLANNNFQNSNNSLTHLEIRHEPFEKIPAGIFTNLSRLRTLRMENNRIHTIANDTFEGLTALTTLSLDSNRISMIFSRSFTGMPRLTTLSLENNNIAFIPAVAFDGMRSLITLSLNNNSLIELQERWFDQKPSLARIHFSENNWDCSCDLKRKYTNITERFNYFVFCPIKQFCITCSSPRALIGQNLIEIDESQIPSCNPNNTNEEDTQEITASPATLAVASTTYHTTSKVPTTTGAQSTQSASIHEISSYSKTMSMKHQVTDNNFEVQSPKLSSDATIPSKASEHLPIWAIALIIALLLVILVSTLFIVFFCVRRPPVAKVQHSKIKIEMQPTTPEKSYEVENEKQIINQNDKV